MGETAIQRTIRLRHRDLLRAVGGELARARLDAGLSQREAAGAAGIHHSHLARIELGVEQPSLAVLTAVATVLGSDLSVRAFPSAGPRLRDHLQARMEEAMLRDVHVRWRRHLEVGVYRPVRGVIDLALADPGVRQVLATEHHSDLHSIEHQLRWAGQKADALPSAREWPFGMPGEPPDVIRLLVLRNTARLRALVTTFAETFAAAFPIAASDARRVLAAPAGAMPGPALLWVAIQGAETRLMDGPPRGVPVGR